MATVTAGYTWASGETVTPTKLNSAATPTVVLADGEVTSAKLASGIDASKLTDASVTNVKLASGIDASKLTTGTLPIARIADAAVTPAKLSQPLTLRTAQATTSGTSFTFSSIPSWVKRITVMFDGVSTNGTTRVQVQLGDAGGVEATGYVSSVVQNTESASPTVSGTSPFTTGFPLGYGAGANRTGALTINNISGNKWVAHGIVTDNNLSSTSQTAGIKTLSDTLTQVLVTTVNGTDAFDAGSVNVMYE
jgi:hypothetical protein